MKIKVLIFAQNTILARALIGVIKNKFIKRFKIVSLCSDTSFYKFCKYYLKFDFDYINNNKKNEKKILKIIIKHNPSIAFSFQHKWILSKKLINALNGNIYNFHFGKIPKFRGHNPINRAILAKEKYFYASTHKISPLVDAGDLVTENKIKNLGDIPRKIEIKFVKSFEIELKKLLNNFLNNKIRFKKKIILKKKNKNFSKFDGIQKFKKIKNFKELEHKATAFNHAPHEPAFFIYKNKKYYVLKDYKEYLENYRYFLDRK
jgi:methionyl-tRNA formyltransferase